MILELIRLSGLRSQYFLIIASFDYICTVFGKKKIRIFLSSLPGPDHFDGRQNVTTGYLNFAKSLAIPDSEVA